MRPALRRSVHRAAGISVLNKARSMSSSSVVRGPIRTVETWGWAKGKRRAAAARGTLWRWQIERMAAALVRTVSAAGM
jgi:hypothetical protein